MKILSLAIVILTISDQAYSQVRTFEILNPSVNNGDTVVIRIEPQWRDPITCIAAFGKHYASNNYGYVLIGVPLMAKSDQEKIFRENCGQGGIPLDNYMGTITITEKIFTKTRTTRRSCGGTRTGPQANAISYAFNPKNMSLPDLTEGKAYIDSVVLTRDIIDSYGFIYSNLPNCPHLGVDLRMPVGISIKAVNKGIVALVARNLSAEGNMVIVNHGLCIFSVYMHLSRINVKDGEVVERGQVVGLSGRTGAGVREPHLHFNIRICDNYVDPLNFIDTVNKVLK